MDLSAALPTFLITLREGVEAALVVGLVLALLQQAQQFQLVAWVYAGILGGIGASALVGLALGGLLQTLETSAQPLALVAKPLLAGSLSLLAIALLSWMLLWMTQQARSLKAEVKGAVNTLLQQGNRAGWGVFSLIFIAVLREGFETVIFIAAQLQQGLMPILGAIAGLVGAVGIGVLLFQWGVQINLRRFFQVMGVLLLLIVSGLVISACKHFDTALTLLAQIQPQWANFCFAAAPNAATRSCLLGPLVWNGAEILPDRRFPGVLLKTLFGYRERLYLVQVVAYGLFLTTMGLAYFRSLTAGSGVSGGEQPRIS